jgi:hypothetical protein
MIFFNKLTFWKTILFYRYSENSENQKFRSESVRKHITAKVRAYSESSRRTDHEYLVSFDVTAAIAAFLSKDFDKASKNSKPISVSISKFLMFILINTILANRIRTKKFKNVSYFLI